MPPNEALDLAKYINDSCPFLKLRGIMSMGKIGNVDEFKAAHELKTKMIS